MRKVTRAMAVMLAAVLVVGLAGAGAAQQMKGMERMKEKAGPPSSVGEELQKLREELKALRQELTGSRRGRMPMGPGMMGGMGMMPQMMPPMMQMMQACGQMMAQVGQMGQMGGMGGMMEQSQGEPPEQAEPTEQGRKLIADLEVTLLAAPPLSPEQMRKLMPGMEEMEGMRGMGGMRQGMQGMQGMMRGMEGMQGMMGGTARPTHWIGVIVRDTRDDRVVKDLPVALMAQKDGFATSATLMPMPGSYGANISLPEKGRYVLTVTIARPGDPLAVPFELEYR